MPDRVQDLFSPIPDAVVACEKEASARLCRTLLAEDIDPYEGVMKGSYELKRMTDLEVASGRVASIGSSSNLPDTELRSILILSSALPPSHYDDATSKIYRFKLSQIQLTPNPKKYDSHGSGYNAQVPPEQADSL